MKILETEKGILNTIKYGPILFVIIISLVITQFFLLEKKNYFNNEIKLVEKTFLIKNKTYVESKIQSILNLIKKEKEKSENTLKKMLKDRVYEAHQIANNIFIEESKLDVEGHSHSKKHIFNTIKNALGGIIYNNGRGYFFISDANGRLLLQPLNKELEGKDFSNFTDANGYKFVKKITKTIKNKEESYDSYFWYFGNDKSKSYKKISFYKYFKPFDVVIGSGEYVKDFENELKGKLLDKIKDIDFGQNWYFFINDLTGKNLFNSKNNLMNKSTKNKDEISSVSLFKDWNWVIGGSFNLSILNKEIEKRKAILIKSKEESVKKIVIISILITFIFIFFSFFISKVISKKFKLYKLNIQKETNKVIEKEKLLIQQSKMATMGEMIGNIAHQWKQPLSVISTANNLIKMDRELDGTFDEKELIKANESIDDSIDNLTTTMDDFRNFFNPNKIGAVFNLQNVFIKTKKLISSQFKNTDIEIIENYDFIELNTYENELLQTLINILKNSKEELVKIDSRRLLFIDVLKQDNQAIIKIKDNAGGIPEDILDKVFNAYFTTKKENSGTGIGLYMSRQIIENMGGEILVSNIEYEYESAIYKGAQFTIKINL